MGQGEANSDLLFTLLSTTTSAYISGMRLVMSRPVVVEDRWVLAAHLSSPGRSRADRSAQRAFYQLLAPSAEVQEPGQACLRVGGARRDAGEDAPRGHGTRRIAAILSADAWQRVGSNCDPTQHMSDRVGSQLPHWMGSHGKTRRWDTAMTAPPSQATRRPGTSAQPLPVWILTSVNSASTGAAKRRPFTRSCRMKSGASIRTRRVYAPSPDTVQLRP